jgi:hypothetical protein
MIHDLRARRDKTLRDITSCSFSYLSDIEHGYVTPTKRVVADIIRELGGEFSAFRGMVTAAQQEREVHKEQMKAVRSGASPSDWGVNYDPKISPDKPRFEIVDDDAGTASTVDPDVVDPATLNFRGPFVTEEINEEHYVSSDRIVYKSLYNRLVRATERGFKVFPWGFGETPPNDIYVSRFQIGARSPLDVGRIAQIGHNSYAVDFVLPRALDAGETYQLSFFKIIDAIGYCDQFIGGSSAVELKNCRMAVFFEPGFEPAKVWWFENLTPYSLPGIFSPWHELKRRATGQYEKEFGSIMPGLMLGIAWSYDD